MIFLIDNDRQPSPPRQDASCASSQRRGRCPGDQSNPVL